MSGAPLVKSWTKVVGKKEHKIRIDGMAGLHEWPTVFSNIFLCLRSLSRLARLRWRLSVSHNLYKLIKRGSGTVRG